MGEKHHENPLNSIEHLVPSPNIKDLLETMLFIGDEATYLIMWDHRMGLFDTIGMG